MKFRKKPVVIEAYQWFEVSPYVEGQKRDVSYFIDWGLDAMHLCQHCNRKLHEHGWMDTLEAGHRVCPGDWIITGVKGEKYPCKPDIFEVTYEKVCSTLP